jgi:HAD superfamily hydrolase (TIGR01662 family)
VSADPQEPADLARLVIRADHLLLDFDGPVCHIFASVPASRVAARLRELIASHVPALPADLANEHDPLQILRHTATLAPSLAATVESTLRAAEEEAAALATPTRHADDVIRAANATGRSVAIVSNNSEAAVRAYLTARGLARHVDVIAARTSPDPALMKPSPYLVRQAVEALDADPAACVLVGDSTTDIDAARAAGVASIGYANKPDKRERMTEAGADAIIDTMAAIAVTLRASHRQTDGTPPGM